MCSVLLLSFITVVYKGVDHLVPGYSYLSWAASRNPDDVNASMHDDNFFYLLCTSMFGGFHIVWMWFSCYLYCAPPHTHTHTKIPLHPWFPSDQQIFHRLERRWWMQMSVYTACDTCCDGAWIQERVVQPTLPTVGEKHRGSELSMKADLPAPTTLLSKLFIATGTATESKHNGT